MASRSRSRSRSPPRRLAAEEEDKATKREENAPPEPDTGDADAAMATATPASASGGDAAAAAKEDGEGKPDGDAEGDGKGEGEGGEAARADSPSSMTDARESRGRDDAPGDKPEAATETAVERVDREKTCPFLLPVYWKFGSHHRPDDFRGRMVPESKLNIYTWKDATLRELTTLMKEGNKGARRKGTRFHFSVVYRDKTGRAFLRDLGVTFNGQKTDDDKKTLTQLRFHIGDYIDVSMSTPRDGQPSRGMDH